MKETLCKNCDNLQEDYPITVIDSPAVSIFDEDAYHFEMGYKCTWNGIASLSVEDLQNGNCRCLDGDSE